MISVPAPIGDPARPTKIDAAALAGLIERELGREGAVYVQNPGNMGDSLIAAGFHAQVSRAGPRIVTAAAYRGIERSVVYSGGGNLVGLYDDCAGAIRRFLEGGEDGRFVLLPHTVRDSEDIIRRLDERFVLFLRDVPSLEYVTQLNPRANCRLADDLAFMLNRDQARDLIRSVPRRLLSAGFRRGFGTGRLLRAIRQFRRGRPLTRRVAIMRRDIERASCPLQLQPGIGEAPDVSGLFVSSFATSHEALACAGVFLWFIDHFDEIHTDRLHVGIGGGLLGKRVFMYDNSYGKNRAVFENSLSARAGFDVTFVSHRSG